jgi:hypothetical protein
VVHALLAQVLPLSGCRGLKDQCTHILLPHAYQYYARDSLTCALCRGYTFYLLVICQQLTVGCDPAVFAATQAVVYSGYSAFGWVGVDPCYAML